MRLEKSKTIICWALVAVCMGVIFWLSSRTAEQSAEQSTGILQWLIDIFGDNFLTNFIVRKSAHLLEFTGLCVLFNLALLQTKKTKMPILSVVITSLYAITDEVHQLFVDGRSCEFRDWAIDSCGAILGSIGFLVLFSIITRLLSRKKVKFVDIENN